MKSEVKSNNTVVGVLGATGFVGSAVAKALADRGALAKKISAPRLVATQGKAISPEHYREAIAALYVNLDGCTSVVNAAGVADSGAGYQEVVWGANALLPGLIAKVAGAHNIRAVHVSSAAVQGRKTILDASDEVDGFSLYARSKIAGEKAVQEANPFAVIYRPPGVHGPGRPVTHAVSRLAKSPFASVAAPGTDNAPQAQINNVADAIAFLAITRLDPPPIVSHPSEGISTSTLMEELGGKRPAHIPRPLARATVDTAFAFSRVFPRLTSQARRLEVLWFGQKQAPSWLTEVGWRPPVGISGWQQLRGLPERFQQDSNTISFPD